MDQSSAPIFCLSVLLSEAPFYVPRGRPVVTTTTARARVSVTSVLLSKSQLYKSSQPSTKFSAQSSNLGNPGTGLVQKHMGRVIPKEVITQNQLSRQLNCLQASTDARPGWLACNSVKLLEWTIYYYISVIFQFAQPGACVIKLITP